MKTYIVLINSLDHGMPRELCEELEDAKISACRLDNPADVVADYIQGENILWNHPESDEIKVMSLSEYMDTMNDTDEDTETIFNDGSYDVDNSFMTYVHFIFDENS